MMGRLGVLKPLRGTESSLANVVLDEGELAFSYPTTGPGTGLGGIKMGDGTSTFSSLPWYITGEGSGPTPTPWEYNEGTDEAALINNIKHCDQETIGKIYYIQAYFDGAISRNNVPYMVIGTNHDGTENTMDLMSKVGARYGEWYRSNNSWSYGKYTTSNFYSWISDTCPSGYSYNIQAKMCYMTERWREATGNDTGILQTRSTKCKLLNPVELFGGSAALYSVTWQYGSTSDYKTDFGSNYGSLYEVWTDSTGALSNRRVFKDLDMSTVSGGWTNSWFASRLNSSNSVASCFYDRADGACDNGYVTYTNVVTPVIRLSDNPS